MSCTGKIHLIAINVNNGYNIDTKGGLCLYGGGHPLFFYLNNFNPRIPKSDITKIMFRNYALISKPLSCITC